jgi:hypothetical protein
MATQQARPMYHDSLTGRKGAQGLLAVAALLKEHVLLHQHGGGRRLGAALCGIQGTAVAAA